MMDTFRHIADAGLYAKIPELAAGIWQALICTAGGIAVAPQVMLPTIIWSAG